MKVVVVSAFAALAALSVAGCAHTTGPYGAVAYSTAAPGYVAPTYVAPVAPYAAYGYTGYAGGPSMRERQLLDRYLTDDYVISPYDGTVAYSSAAGPGVVVGQSPYLAERKTFPPPSDPQGCNRYIIDQDDPCFAFSF